MKLTYIFEIDEDIYQIEGLHLDLDTCVENSLSINTKCTELIRSTLESPEEISGRGESEEHQPMNWEEAVSKVKTLIPYYQEIGWNGSFGLSILKGYLLRYEGGERSQELYNEMIESE